MAFPTADSVMTGAAELAGSDDFGPMAFRSGLDRTLDAFARVALNDATRALVTQKIINDLATRCRVEAWYKANPGIEDEEIEGPVLVCGLPRTGTTATVGMMALDPRFRFLRAWEAIAPIPPPVAGEEDGDPRVVAARQAAKNYEKPNMHIHDPDGPEEDISLLSPLAMHGFYGAYPMPNDYMHWWANLDYRDVYAYHRRIMKLLQSRRGPRLWLLKAPPHLFHLEAFAATFPNARFIMTHRDPAKVIASVASLQSTMQAARTEPGAIDRHERGHFFQSFYADGLNRGLAARASIGETRFIDVTNDEVVRDPMSVFERVYDHIGLTMNGDFADRVAAYNARNAQSAGGQHHYAAEDYGLSREGIREAFAGYIDRFGV